MDTNLHEEAIFIKICNKTTVVLMLQIMSFVIKKNNINARVSFTRGKQSQKYCNKDE